MNMEPSGADGGRVNLPTGGTPPGGVKPLRVVKPLEIAAWLKDFWVWEATRATTGESQFDAFEGGWRAGRESAKFGTPAASRVVEEERETLICELRKHTDLILWVKGESGLVDTGGLRCVCGNWECKRDATGLRPRTEYEGHVADAILAAGFRLSSQSLAVEGEEQTKGADQ